MVTHFAQKTPLGFFQGANSYGQLSQGHKDDKLSPGVASVKLNVPVSCITGGGGHSILITGEMQNVSGTEP